MKQSTDADVEIGSFLSGGIDSTLITCLAQSFNSKPIKTFTVGSENSKFNEANYAKEIAKYLGTNHTELYVSNDTLLKTCEEVDVAYDEPFSDPSKILTYLLSQVAATKVKAVVSGDGADELFCGYNRYIHAENINYINTLFPIGIRRKLISPLLHSLASLFKNLSALKWI